LMMEYRDRTRTLVDLELDAYDQPDN
jgi:hypothetical protein